MRQQLKGKFNVSITYRNNKGTWTLQLLTRKAAKNRNTEAPIKTKSSKNMESTKARDSKASIILSKNQSINSQQL